MRTHLLVYSLISLFLFSSASAQENVEPFNTLSLGISAVKDFHENSFQTSWEPQLGIEGYIRTPFYIGTLHTGLTYSAYGSKVSGYPDFKLYLIYLQWDYEYELGNTLTIAFGGRFGLTEMRFDENDIVSDKNLLNETEFTAGIVARISIFISSDWQFNLSANYIDVFTYPRMHSLYLGAGISKLLVTPDWLKELLQ